MADREQIQDVLADYAWGNDAKDEAVLNSVFSDDARFYLTIAGVEEPIGPFEGREAIVGFIYPTIKAQTDQRRHAIVNHRFLVDEPSAPASGPTSSWRSPTPASSRRSPPACTTCGLSRATDPGRSPRWTSRWTVRSSERQVGALVAQAAGVNSMCNSFNDRRK